MFHRLFNSSQKVLMWTMMVVFFVSIFVPNGAFSSALLALERGKSICVVPGCLKPVAAEVQYERTAKPLLGSGGRGVGFCEEHAKKPPSTMESHNLTWGRYLALFGLLCVALYIYGFVQCFPRGKVPAPPSETSTDPASPAESHGKVLFVKRFAGDSVSAHSPETPGRKVRHFFLITLAAVIVVNVGFWFMARYI